MGTTALAVSKAVSQSALLQFVTAGTLNSYLTEIELQAQALSFTGITEATNR